MQKTEIDYIESNSQTVIEIEDETDQDKKDYLLTAIDFNKVNLTKAWENQEKNRRYFRCSCWFTTQRGKKRQSSNNKQYLYWWQWIIW